MCANMTYLVSKLTDFRHPTKSDEQNARFARNPIILHTESDLQYTLEVKNRELRALSSKYCTILLHLTSCVCNVPQIGCRK